MMTKIKKPFRVLKIKDKSIDDAFSEITASDTYNGAYNSVLQDGQIGSYYLIVDLHEGRSNFFRLNKTLEPVGSMVSTFERNELIRGNI